MQDTPARRRFSLGGYRLPLRGADFIVVRGVLLDHLAAEAA